MSHEPIVKNKSNKTLNLACNNVGETEIEFKCFKPTHGWECVPGSESAFSLKFSRSKSRERPSASPCSSSPASLDSGHCSLRSPHPDSLRLSPGSPGQVHVTHVTTTRVSRYETRIIRQQFYQKAKELVKKNVLTKVVPKFNSIQFQLYRSCTGALTILVTCLDCEYVSPSRRLSCLKPHPHSSHAPCSHSCKIEFRIWNGAGVSEEMSGWI